MFEKYEFGWRVDMKLTKPQADSVVKAIKNIVDSWAKANTDAYYKSVVKVDMDVGKGGNVSFLNVLGDVFHCKWWTRGGSDALADRLGLAHVPTVFTGTLSEAVAFVSDHKMSTINPSHEMEGLVLEPMCGGLFTSSGAVLKCKVKYRDLKANLATSGIPTCQPN